jgi:hypothetical protein
MRELDRHGGASGRRTIHYIADNDITPVLKGADATAQECEGGEACSGGKRIVIANKLRVGDIAAELAHETMHLALGDLRTDPARVRASHEILAIRSAVLAAQGMSPRILGVNQRWWGRRYRSMGSQDFDNFIYNRACPLYQSWGAPGPC